MSWPAATLDLERWGIQPMIGGDEAARRPSRGCMAANVGIKSNSTCRHRSNELDSVNFLNIKDLYFYNRAVLLEAVDVISIVNAPPFPGGAFSFLDVAIEAKIPPRWITDGKVKRSIPSVFRANTNLLGVAPNSYLCMYSWP
jgi:hypothetical protein